MNDLETLEAWDLSTCDCTECAYWLQVRATADPATWRDLYALLKALAVLVTLVAWWVW